MVSKNRGPLHSLGGENAAEGEEQKDLYAGLIFVAFGARFAIIARDYPMGSALRMRPAYFPAILGSMLVMPGRIAAMCGRYALYGPRSRSRAESVYFSDLERFAPTYNAAPGQWLPVTRVIDGAPRMSAAKWGLVPFWAKDERSGFKCINARIETLATSPMFRSAYRARRRCLVPASGFFEWQKRTRVKRPFYITSPNGSLLAYAGLWDEWRRPGEEALLTYTIVTTSANELVRSLHDRMPVILRPDDYAVWLEAADATDIISHYPAELLRAYPVSDRVNSPQNNDPDLLRADDDDELLK